MTKLNWTSKRDVLFALSGYFGGNIRRDPCTVLRRYNILQHSVDWDYEQFLLLRIRSLARVKVADERGPTSILARESQRGSRAHARGTFLANALKKLSHRRPAKYPASYKFRRTGRFGMPREIRFRRSAPRIAHGSLSGHRLSFFITAVPDFRTW